MKRLYVQKQKEQLERTSAFCEFLVELATACFGGSKKQDEVNIDTGEGIDELTDEQLQQMKEMLGPDFEKMYGHLL